MAAESKKILLVTRPIAPPWDEASKNFAYYLAKNSTGHDLSLLTHGKISDLPESVGQKDIYSYHAFDWIQKLRLFWGLYRMRNDFDIFHLLFTPTRFNTFFFRLALGKNHARTIQTIATLREDLYSDADIRKIIFADRIITYSDQAKKKLESLGFGNVERIYPGIDLEHFSPAPQDESLKESLGIRKGDFIVTYPGEFVRLGAMDPLVDLIISEKALWKEQHIRFILACRVKNEADRLKKAEVVEKLETADCSDLAIFTDTFADMPRLYNLSDVIIFPVRDMKGKFDVPLAAIEPMACQKPVIVSDLPILKEFATSENSLSIDRRDFRTLKAAILELRSDPRKAALIAANGKRFAAENFNIRKIAEKYDALYDKI